LYFKTVFDYKQKAVLIRYPDMHISCVRQHNLLYAPK